MKKSYIFTNKSYSEYSVLSALLGLLSLVSQIVAVVGSYRREGAPDFRYGMAVFLSMLFSFAGLGFGVYARTERDRFYLFAYIGMALNFLGLVGVSLILPAGV